MRVGLLECGSVFAPYELVRAGTVCYRGMWSVFAAGAFTGTWHRLARPCYSRVVSLESMQLLHDDCGGFMVLNMLGESYHKGLVYLVQVAQTEQIATTEGRSQHRSDSPCASGRLCWCSRCLGV